MPDTRPRNAEGQFSPETGGGANPGSFQAAYNPAIIMQNDQSRKAIMAAVNSRKQQNRGVEVTQPSGASDTILSRKDFEGLKCWDGYQAKGKKKGKDGKMVNNCVKLSFLGRLTELSAKSSAWLDIIREVDNTEKHRAVMKALQGTQRLGLGKPPVIKEYKLGPAPKMPPSVEEARKSVEESRANLLRRLAS
jgi:hypothetical protein